MAFHKNGYRFIAPLGVPSATSAEGSTRGMHTYVTNDDRAAIETSNYFDPLLDPLKVKNGDVLIASYDTDGTPGGRMYILTIASDHVVATPFYETPAA